MIAGGSDACCFELGCDVFGGEFSTVCADAAALQPIGSEVLHTCTQVLLRDMRVLSSKGGKGQNGDRPRTNEHVSSLTMSDTLRKYDCGAEARVGGDAPGRWRSRAGDTVRLRSANGHDDGGRCPAAGRAACRRLLQTVGSYSGFDRGDALPGLFLHSAVWKYQYRRSGGVGDFGRIPGGLASGDPSFLAVASAARRLDCAATGDGEAARLE